VAAGVIGPFPTECNAAGGAGFEPWAPPQTTWLFKTREDESERCDLSLVYSDVVTYMKSRLGALQATAVPCRFPNGDPVFVDTQSTFQQESLGLTDACCTFTKKPTVYHNDVVLA
jgi:hypothetical protein